MISKQATKVGVFVIVGILALALGVFVVGDNRQTWAPKVQYVARFKDVAGLKSGAPVKLGGVDVGLVTRVAYGNAQPDALIEVRVNIKRSEATRIRVGTTASVAMMGMLGDKMLVLKEPRVREGEPPPPELPPDGSLQTDEGDDIVAKLQGTVGKISDRLDEIGALTKPLSDPKFVGKVSDIVEHTHEITEAIARSDSVAHRLLMDPREGERVDVAITNLEVATQRLAAILGSMQDVAEHVQGGPGIAHALVYDGELSKNTAATVDEVHRDLEAVRKGNGLAHTVVYGDDAAQHVIGNVNAMTDDMRAIVADVRAGKGTIGGLLVDPTIYEDLKSAVGNVERNQVLRALVRYAIKEDESQQHGDKGGRTPKP